MYVLIILRSEMLPTLTASKATLLCTRPISKEATFPSTGLSCKTGRLAGNQPRRKWLLVMEQSRETLSCTFWSKEGKCWNVDMKIITGNYAGFDCCVQTCTHIFKSSASERLKSPQRFVRSPFAKFAQVSEFCDHNFSKTQLHKAPVVHISLNLFWSLTIIITNMRLPERRSRWCLNFSFQQELTDHSCFFFLQSQEGDTRDATEPFCGSPPCENQPW